MYKRQVQALAVPLLAHRIILTSEAHVSRLTPAGVVEDVIARTRVPGRR